MSIVNKLTLKELRATNRYTLSELSLLLGISEEVLSFIETTPDKVPINFAARLALFYDTPTSMIKWN